MSVDVGDAYSGSGHSVCLIWVKTGVKECRGVMKMSVWMDIGGFSTFSSFWVKLTVAKHVSSNVVVGDYAGELGEVTNNVLCVERADSSGF